MKVKLFDVHALCRLTYVKRAFRNCTREQQASREHAHCGFDVPTPKHFFDRYR